MYLEAARLSGADDSRLAAEIEGALDAKLEERLRLGAGYKQGDVVFAREDGSPLDPDVVSQAFGRRVRRAGLPEIGLHDLRHTHATLALAAGVHPKVVQERLATPRSR